MPTAWLEPTTCGATLRLCFFKFTSVTSAGAGRATAPDAWPLVDVTVDVTDVTVERALVGTGGGAREWLVWGSPVRGTSVDVRR